MGREINEIAGSSATHPLGTFLNTAWDEGWIMQWGMNHPVIPSVDIQSDEHSEAPTISLSASSAWEWLCGFVQK